MVMDDHWVPHENNAFIQTINPALQNQTVSYLMSITENGWDVDLILDMFNSRYAELILSIPIDKEVHDSWYWRREKLGNYSVKSAYHLIQDEKK